jgi:hypothetical protein
MYFICRQWGMATIRYKMGHLLNTTVLATCKGADLETSPSAVTQA